MITYSQSVTQTTAAVRNDYTVMVFTDPRSTNIPGRVFRIVLSGSSIWAIRAAMLHCASSSMGAAYVVRGGIIGSALLQTTGQNVGLIAKLLHSLKDALSGLFLHKNASGEGA